MLKKNLTQIQCYVLDSKNAILRSCGAGIAAADDLMLNNERIFCAIRPPGHHAETTRANGFCFINNIAVAARYLQKKYKINKVAIIDFDVHHGNGTQEIFYNDKSVAYASIHEYPYFLEQVQKMKLVWVIFLMHQ